MDTEEIRRLFKQALAKFLEKDSYLLLHNVGERAITHRLAVYIEEEFRPLDLDVDCEYNRNGDNPKILYYIENIVEEELKRLVKEGEDTQEILQEIRTYPDIIVHKRGCNRNNILIVEAKKTGRYLNETTRNLDYRKLELFTKKDDRNGFGYKLGIFLVLSENGTEEIIEYIDGRQV